MIPLAAAITQTYDVAQIMWAVVALALIMAVTLLLWKGIIKSGKISFKGNEFNFGAAGVGDRRKLSPNDQALLAMATLTEAKYQTANDIRAAQKRAIDEHYEQFMDVLHAANYFPAEVLWRHFCDPLVNAADENHILTHLDAHGNIGRDYVAKKMLFVQSRHRRMVEKLPGCLPEWLAIEQSIEIIMVAALMEFSAIAAKGWGDFKSSVDNVRLLAPRMVFLLDRLVEGI